MTEKRNKSQGTLADTLRVDAQSISPHMHDFITSHYPHEIIPIIIDLYGRYVPISRFAKINRAKRQIVVTNMNSFAGAWDTNRAGIPVVPLGYSNPEQEIIVIENPFDLWDGLSQSTKGFYSNSVRKFKGQPSIYYMDAFLRTTLTEEFLHQFQAELPWEVAECGVRYYKQKVLQTIGSAHFNASESDKKAIEQWENFISLYGEERVHKMFFGSLDYSDPDNQQMLRDITNKIRQKVEELLPDYYSSKER